MELNDVIALAKAGFTKEDIEKFSSFSNTPAAAAPKVDAEPAPAAAPAAAPEPETSAEPAPDPFAAFNEAAAKALEQFQEKINNIQMIAGMPSINNVAPKGSDDIIRGFLDNR